MLSQKPIILAVAVIFLVLACLALYRLLFWFPITIGGAYVGQTASFFTFVICAALSLILFRSASVPR
jgi:hypothetical protein